MGWKVAVAGADGMAGRELLKILSERGFPVDSVAALAGGHSACREVSFGDDDLRVQAVETFSFKGIDLAFFAGDAALSARHACDAARAGAAVIDGSPHFRLAADVPLVVPEVNPEAMGRFSQRNMVASPSSAAIMLALVLKPLSDEAGVRRAVATCMAPVSGEGSPGMDELFSQTRAVFMNGQMTSEVFPKQVAFNLLPQVGNIRKDGSDEAEFALAAESARLLGADVSVAAHFVRVPVFIGEAMTLAVECAGPLSPASARKCLRDAPGVMVVDRPGDGGYATPAECAGEDAVFASRIRKDSSVKNGLSIFCIMDNIRKGCSLNMVQIAEMLVGSQVMII